jgi:hypothetical protein
METLQVKDGSDEVRIEICGTLTGNFVTQLREVWETSQSNQFWRRFVVDISALAGYDSEGHELLHCLQRHGAVFAAGTPRSLEYLEEITSGILRRATVVQIRRPADRSASPRARHRAGVGTYETSARSR